MSSGPPGGPPGGGPVGPDEKRRPPRLQGARPAADQQARPDISPRMQRLMDGLDLQRNKLNHLIGALVSTGVLGPATIGSPHADVVPEEQRLRGSSTCVIVFGGMAQRLSLPAPEFLKTLTDTEADVLYFKDFHQCWYQQGLAGLSHDIPSTVAHIRARLAAHPYTRIVAIGTSAGAFAAILFGVMLGAHRIVAMGPQTLVNEASFKHFASVDSRVAEIDFTSDTVDLAKLLDTHPYTGEIEIYYGAHHTVDAAAAERLRRFPSVTLKPLDMDHHNVAFRLKREGKLLQALGI